MTFHRATRRRFAILAADVAGYARLMETDEEGTLARLMRLWEEVVEPEITRHGGWLVKRVGDGVIATFDGADEAVACAIAIQATHATRVVPDLSTHGLPLRIALHVCDALVESGDIYGEGVNVAARLQAYAAPGGIIASSTIKEALGGKFGVPTVDLGELPLKNISRPISATSLHASGLSGLPEQLLATTTEKPTIAVLPFRMAPTAPDDAWFADGMVEDIIQALGALRDLFVIARGSTLGFTDPWADLREVSAKLHVRYVLRGSVRRSLGRVRLTAELAEAESGAVLWADRFDGEGTDLFALQDHIAAEVVAKLAPQMRASELRHSLRKHPESLHAYDYMLQALDQLHRLDYSSFCSARGLLQQAMAADPGYALPYAYAAQWHIFRVGQRWSPDPEADAREAARLAEMAATYDSGNALALALHGHAQAWLLRHYNKGQELFRQALDCNPSCAMAWTLSSCTSSYLGDGAEAVSRAEQGLRLSPYDTFGFYSQGALTIAHYADEAHEKAVDSGRRGAALNPSYGSNLRFLTASLVALERMDEARATAGALMQVQPSFRLASYAPTCPFSAPQARDLFISRLRDAGLPD